MITLEGLVIAVGADKANKTFEEFNKKYDEKHGTYIQSVMRPDWISYAVRREKVWNRYSLHEVYRFEKEIQKKSPFIGV